ncbi:hypothetical protein K2173_000314 [Erythroxylum novogranatense]|uniref:Uncharacterized protein n=1 Tax=Erythroxylum novogranatense TaxID=1862640 RepID=A0AAV8SW84_9ROSI|nr:hypothetical protein K2173_000314 [Erythroxylum novogranatense]
MPPSGEIPKPKPSRKKVAKRGVPMVQLQENGVREVQQGQQSMSLRVGKKAFKRSSKDEGSPLFRHLERSSSESLPDSSTASNEYWALRRKYLMLEEESFGMGRELREVEDEVRILEAEKLALLDQLVVLEGLIDPSEVQPQGLHLP